MNCASDAKGGISSLLPRLLTITARWRAVFPVCVFRVQALWHNEEIHKYNTLGCYAKVLSQHIS